jgi:hypothetical protein
MLRNAGGPGGENTTRSVIRSFVTVIATLGFAAFSFAQPIIGPSIAPGQNLHGRFQQERHLKGITVTLTSSGSFVLAPGKGLIWRIEQPIQTVTVITPVGIRQIVNGSEVQRIEASHVPVITHFYDMLNGSLTGDWSTMHHDFAVQTTGDQRGWRTTLTPLRATDPIVGTLSSIVITGAKMVDAVNILRTNGDSERLTFLDQAISDVPLSEGDARLLTSNAVIPTD